MSDDEQPTDAADDWFERGLTDDEKESADKGVTADEDSSAEDDDAESVFSSSSPTGFGSDGEPDDSASGFGFGDEEPAGFDDFGFDEGEDFGMGSDLFDDDFASAFASAPGPDGSGGFGGTDFEDEAFESNIPRIDIGILGLDDMIQGGVPESSLMVTIGSAGTGKTTFGLQFLHHGLENGEKAIYITLEESRRQVINTAVEKGYDFDTYIEEGSLAVVDLDPVEMANSLDNIRSELPKLISEFGASRFVLDSVSLLEMMYDQQAKRRTEIFNFTRALKQAGITTMLTSEASDDNPYASRHGIVEYLTDAVFILQYVRPSDFRETRLAVEIQKIRNANHSRETKPYEITGSGISVYQQANIF
ncbi:MULTISPECIES: KaiC domain-containing protein [unclassified Haladaptatus]|uniref:KaiC domain-containing protein n=1 Tax=unclassified Haladaptatus TaxID=2622732 RepID=UPI0023E8408A|nr:MULTISPECIES: KaiC domain-containing protein [unclassified Haladaptatus]